MSGYVHKSSNFSHIFPDTTEDTYYIGPLTEDELNAIRARMDFSPGLFLLNDAFYVSKEERVWFESEIGLANDFYERLSDKLGPPGTQRVS